MSKELKTGIVASLIIILSIWGFNFLKGQHLFDGNSRFFYIEYNNIQGLNKSSIVTISGLQVGKVSDITFNTDPTKKGNLIVEIMIDNDFEFSKNSIAKLYSTSLLGGEALAIIPSYEGELAASGDYLKGEVEIDVLSSVQDSFNPLKSTLSDIMANADSLLVGLNQILDDETRNSLQRSIVGLETTVGNLNHTIVSVDSIVNASKSSIDTTLANAKTITTNVAQLSDTLVNANIGIAIKKLQTTLDNVNGLLTGIENGEGTLGKLAKDDAMYTNLTNASKELEELLREMKLNPKRFVHFSLFGKKGKPYDKELNNENVSNQ